ncbi:MAG: GH1 family beta-glucosidase [Bacteroidota bacterium]
MKNHSFTEEQFHSKNFGNDFIWGISASALQSEGAHNTDGKGNSIWDTFSDHRKKILNGDTPKKASEFYHRYKEDIAIIKSLHIPNFRFSISWSRILPNGIGEINQPGIDFYNRVIDECLANNIEPWVTLYHWDLPLALSHKGGWTNREIIHWFTEYASLCIRTFGDRVKHWMILNEPMVFTGAGYFLGVHAPGEKGLKKFLPAVHHAVLCQAIGAKVIKSENALTEVGSTFSCSYITPNSNSDKDHAAANRIDALINRLFIETALGLGYPYNELPLLKKIEKYIKPGDEKLMKADFDFIGLQNYTREVVAHTYFVPYLQAKVIRANKRKVYHTTMDWEVYPEAIYEMIKKISNYAGVKKIIVTENGAAFHDEVQNEKINDEERIIYLSNYLKQVHRAKADGHKISGYFVWALTDNFEWTEGYYPRFGLVHVNFETQKRIIKQSGYWYKNFLKRKEILKPLHQITQAKS